MKRNAMKRYETLHETLQVVDFKRMKRMKRLKAPRTHSAMHTPNATTPPHTHLAYTCNKRFMRFISYIKDLQRFKRFIKRFIWPFKRFIGGVAA